MPFSPPQICQYCRRTGCDCRDKAKKQRQQVLDDRRGSPSSRGYDSRWVKLRALTLSESPLCEDCKASGLVRAANEVHHIAKVSDRPELRLERDNLMTLCKACHSKRTARGE